jgi:hypothetical protein
VYALFLEMLFTERNTHLRGLNEICRALMAMNGIQHRLSRRYLATISWAIINYSCKHFSESMPMDDLTDTTSAMLIWSRSDLENFEYQMNSASKINLITFPDEWATMLARGEQAMQSNSGPLWNSSGSGAGWGGNREQPHNSQRDRRQAYDNRGQQGGHPERN